MQYEEQDYQEKFKLSSWIKLIGYAKPLRWSLLVMIISITGTATIDIIFPILTQIVIDDYIGQGVTEGIWRFGFMYFAVVLAQSIFIWLHIRYAGKVEVGATYYIRKAAYEKLQQLSFSFYDKTAVGYLLARLGSDCERLGGTIGWALLDLLWGAMVMTLASVAMFIYNWQLALMVYIVIPPLAIVYLTQDMLMWSVVYCLVLLLGNAMCVKGISDRITRPQIMSKL